MSEFKKRVMIYPADDVERDPYPSLTKQESIKDCYEYVLHAILSEESAKMGVDSDLIYVNGSLRCDYQLEQPDKLMEHADEVVCALGEARQHLISALTDYKYWLIDSSEVMSRTEYVLAVDLTVTLEGTMFLTISIAKR